MVRLFLDLKPFREEIQILITERLILEDIIRIIRDTYSHACSYRILKRRVKAWNII
jgi:hypothetical protein